MKYNEIRTILKNKLGSTISIMTDKELIADVEYIGYQKKTEMFHSSIKVLDSEGYTLYIPIGEIEHISI